MSQLLAAKPPQLGKLSQYSDPDTSSSSVLSHGSSLFDKITPTSTASEEGSGSPLPSLSEEKDLPANVATMEVDLSTEVPISPFDPDFEMYAVEAGDGEDYSSVMPLIDYAPDHSVDIEAITPDSMVMVMRLQALGCKLDAGTILNKIASAKAEAKAKARSAAGYEVGSLQSEPTYEVDWLGFIEAILPGCDIRKVYMDFVSAVAPRLGHTQLSDIETVLPNTNFEKAYEDAPSAHDRPSAPPPAPRLRPTQLSDIETVLSNTKFEKAYMDSPSAIGPPTAPPPAPRLQPTQFPDIETIPLDTNVERIDMDSPSAIPPLVFPPPAPRLQPTQLPDDHIPELSLFDSFPSMEAQISEFAASLKAAAALRASSASSRGVQAVATPASMLFGGMPEPVSMRVPMSAFGFSGGSPRDNATPKQSERTPVPLTRDFVGNEGVTSGEGPGFRLDIGTPELHQAFHDGFAASNSLLDMALQLEMGSAAFSSSPARDLSKMREGSCSQPSPGWDFPSFHSPTSAGQATPVHGWDTPSKHPLGPIFPLQLANTFSQTTPAGKAPVSYSHSSSVVITTTDSQSQIVQSCSTLSLLQHSPSQSSMHRLPSAAQVPLQTMSLSQPHLASHSSHSPKGTRMSLGKVAHMNATAEFDGVVEEICELLVSEKTSGNVQLYLETLTYQLESMLRESQAVLMQEIRESRTKERSSGRISRRGALRKPSRHARRDFSVVSPQTPPSPRPSSPAGAGSPSSSRSSSPSVSRWSPSSSSTSSSSLNRDAHSHKLPASASSTSSKGLASFLPSNLRSSRGRLSRSFSFSS